MKLVSASPECRSPPMWADELVFANYLNLATPRKQRDGVQGTMKGLSLDTGIWCSIEF